MLKAVFAFWGTCYGDSKGWKPPGWVRGYLSYLESDTK